MDTNAKKELAGVEGTPPDFNRNNLTHTMQPATKTKERRWQT